MPSIEVPFWLPDTDTNSASGHFVGSQIFTSPAIDYRNIIDTHTDLTDANALATDDTTTYATVDLGGFDADMVAAGYRTPGDDLITIRVRGSTTTSATIPLDATGLIVTAIITLKAEGFTANFAPSLRVPGAASLTFSSQSMTAGWTRYEVSRSTLSASYVLGPLRDALIGATAQLSTSFPTSVSEPPGVYRVAYMALRVSWETIVAPVLRVHPRSDGRGLSSARRVWPPNKAAQDKRWLPYGGGYR